MNNARYPKPLPGRSARTARKDANAVELDNPAGEHLFFRLTAEGGQAAFAFGCRDRDILIADDFPGHPKEVYEWAWAKMKER